MKNLESEIKISKTREMEAADEVEKLKVDNERIKQELKDTLERIKNTERSLSVTMKQKQTLEI